MLACAVAFLFIALLDGFEGFTNCDPPGKAAGILSILFLLVSLSCVLLEVL